MQHETKPESAGAKRTLAGSAVGYGIVCGLTFPLMISSTFLQEMSLSHGAGDAFGALFFLAYALTMAGTALAYALRRKPTRRARIVSAFAAAFLGNAETTMMASANSSSKVPDATKMTAATAPPHRNDSGTVRASDTWPRSCRLVMRAIHASSAVANP